MRLEEDKFWQSQELFQLDPSSKQKFTLSIRMREEDTHLSCRITDHNIDKILLICFTCFFVVSSSSHLVH